MWPKHVFGDQIDLVTKTWFLVTKKDFWWPNWWPKPDLVTKLVTKNRFGDQIDDFPKTLRFLCYFGRPPAALLTKMVTKYFWWPNWWPNWWPKQFCWPNPLVTRFFADQIGDQKHFLLTKLVTRAWWQNWWPNWWANWSPNRFADQIGDQKPVLLTKLVTKTLQIWWPKMRPNILLTKLVTKNLFCWPKIEFADQIGDQIGDQKIIVNNLLRFWSPIWSTRICIGGGNR